MSAEETPYHHGSHRRLLLPPGETPAVQRGIDAIIVPTIRRPVYLAEAAKLARALGCVLVTLHSGKLTSAARAARRFRYDVDLIAVDVPDAAQLRLPRWDTSRLLSGTAFASRSDLSVKRNMALVLCRVRGWSRVLFLDDDITQVDPEDVRRAGGLLDTYNAVGLQVGGFPDHSVVCHAYRDAGGKQQSFVGGGAMAVAVDRISSFFPEIYNDDWFFLLDGGKTLQPTTMTGQVTQYRYDPFRSPDRARAEELGDVLAEGMYWLLDQERTIADADTAHWAGFLRKRRRFIEDVLGMVERDSELDLAGRVRRIAALKGSLGRLSLITPELCERYLDAWQNDLAKWQRHLDRLPSRLESDFTLAVLSRLGHRPLTWHGSQSLSCRAAKPAPRPAFSGQPGDPAGLFASGESELAAPRMPVPAGMR